MRPDNPFRRVARHTPAPLDGLLEYAAGALNDVEELANGLPADPLDAWDAEHIRRTLPYLEAVNRVYFRGEVTGIENIPTGASTSSPTTWRPRARCWA